MDVANGEDPGAAGLQEEGKISVELDEVVVRNIPARQYEPGAVGGQLTLEPLGVRRGADEDEQRAGGRSRALARPCVSDRHHFQLTLAVELNNLCVPHHLDRIVAFDLVDEVTGHRLAQIPAADQESAVRGTAGE